MGRQAKAKQLRKVIGNLSLTETRQVKPGTAEQFGVGLRSLRKAALKKLTGTGSVEQVVHAFCRANGVDGATFEEATQWATTIRAAHPKWTPGEKVPE